MKNKQVLDKILKLNSLVSDPSQPKKTRPFSESRPVDEGSPHSTLFDKGKTLSLSSNFSLPISQIECDRSRQRKLTPVERNRLLKSIKEDGLWSAITVEKIETNRFRIISGHNRYEICTSDLGWKEIPARVVDFSTSSEKAAFISNLLQPELSIAEIFNGLCILRSDADGCRMGNKEIAQETGFSPAYVSQVFSMEKLSPKVIAALYEAKVLTGANTIRSLVNAFPDEQRDPIVFDQITEEFVQFINIEVETLNDQAQADPELNALDVSRDYWTKRIRQFISDRKKRSRPARPSTKFDPFQQGTTQMTRTNNSLILRFDFANEEEAIRAEKEFQTKLK